MRRAFTLVESLFALMIFCILLIASSKILLELSRSHIAYSKAQMRQIEVQNALFVIEKYLKYSVAQTLNPTSISLYPLNLSVYFSPSFSPIPKQCRGNEIEFANTDFVYSKLDGGVIRVLRQKGGVLELDRGVQCGYFLPLSSPITLSLSPQKELLLNGEVLLRDVKKFEISQKQNGVRVMLCECELNVEWSKFL